jgi:hypothetical protein
MHNNVPGNPTNAFPRIRITLEKVTRMMGNVNSGKGIAYDGITDRLFQVGKDGCRKKNEYCEECRTKINFVAKFM